MSLMRVLHHAYHHDAPWLPSHRFAPHGIRPRAFSADTGGGRLEIRVLLGGGSKAEPVVGGD